MPNLAIFTFADYISISLLNELIPELYRSGINVTLFETQKRFNKKLKSKSLDRLTFYEIDTLRVVTRYIEKNPFPEARYKPLSALAKEYGINVIPFDDVNEPRILDHITSIEDLVGTLSIRLGHVFGDRFIDHARARSFPAWNLHGGLLPDYKGLYIPYRVIQNHGTMNGWSLHEVDYSIDTGSIIATCSLPLNYSKPILETYLDMIPQAVPMIVENINKSIKGCLPNLMNNQSTRDVSYYSFPTEEMIDDFEARGVYFTPSPMAYVHGLIDRFSQQGTAHALGLQEELIQSIAEFERRRLGDIQPAPAKETEKAA